MTKETVTLEQEQWTQVLNILTTAPTPWIVSNPLVNAIVPQLQQQRDAQQMQGVLPNGHLDPQRSITGEPATRDAADTGFPPGTRNIVRG